MDLLRIFEAQHASILHMGYCETLACLAPTLLDQTRRIPNLFARAFIQTCIQLFLDALTCPLQDPPRPTGEFQNGAEITEHGRSEGFLESTCIPIATYLKFHQTKVLGPPKSCFGMSVGFSARRPEIAHQFIGRLRKRSFE